MERSGRVHLDGTPPSRDLSAGMGLGESDSLSGRGGPSWRDSVRNPVTWGYRTVVPFHVKHSPGKT